MHTPVIVFDFFGVICSEIAPFVLPKYMSAEEATHYKATIVQDADIGRISQAEMFERLGVIAHAPAQKLEDEFWSYVKIDPDTVALIEDLRKKYRVALLTNAIVPFVREIMARYDLERLFDTILVSAEEHMTKPDPAYFTLLCRKMGVAAGDCIFLDDNPVNLEGAKTAGLATVLFTGAPAARAELKTRFGVSTE
jgi:putative hydrolase of the HAD superfamily